MRQVLLLVLGAGVRALQPASTVTTAKTAVGDFAPDHDLLIRAARGEETERTPVWLMRQAGRYMADFRAYSEKYPFRMRSETPEIATELSLQCWRKFGVDGVIMFSDILTPLPALGVEFDVVPGRGPIITDTLRSADRVAAFTREAARFSPAEQLPFVGETLRNLRRETEGKTSLVGFVGAPWTLAAYATEGGSSRHALHIHKLMRDEPKLAHDMLSAMADSIGAYAVHQVDNGAQVIQVFESWAHHLSPKDFATFSKPYALRVAAAVKAAHPDVPVIFFANGGSSYLELQTDMVGGSSYSALSLDWKVDLKVARSVLGADVAVQGNMKPTILLGSAEGVEDAVRENIVDAGGGGNRHILNLGHGVLQETPEANVGAFVDACKKYGVRS
ncbi:Uroporphyrinogen decarboxylase [Pelagophyceae sp. CCMP2097]|nr:Uroporphyrinogen decarboxylase [Pelagophyceae sp. CCMP2097]